MEYLMHSGSFKDYNDNEIIVSFYKKSEEEIDESENDLKFSGKEPVVINYNGNVDDIYAPMKTSSCDVNIVSEHILDDLYTPNKNDVYMKVVRKSPKMVRQVTTITPGTVESETVEYDNGSHSRSWPFRPVSPYIGVNIFDGGQLFTDINGDVRYTGVVRRDSYGYYNVALKYDTSTGKWIEENPWMLNIDIKNNVNFQGDYYFYAGNTSYKVSYNGSTYTVQVWMNGYWGPEHDYNKVDNGIITPCKYRPDFIFHYIDGTTEFIYLDMRYTWDATNLQWVRTTTYHPDDDYSFTEYAKVLDKSGNLVDGAVAYGDNDTYMVKLDRTNNTMTTIVSYPDVDGWLFTDDAGYIYYMYTDGVIYSWSWELKEWVRWINFTGDVEDFELRFIIPGTPKKLMIHYMDTVEDRGMDICLTGLTHPLFKAEWVVVPGQWTYTTLFEGYKMPNTYSQDVTQNLEEISMTCIDPVALLKYVKIDKIFSRPAIKTYGEIIGKALAYVMLDNNRLLVERNVTYGSTTHTSTNHILNMSCQISNFWDEGEEPATLYEVIEELLRPFCLTLQYINGYFCIFNQSRYGESEGDLYYIDDDGDLSSGGSQSIDTELFDFAADEWKSNNTENATIQIGSTYNGVSAVASTSIPKYSSMVTDKVNYNDRDKYDIGQGNIQRNKTKGYRYYTTPGSVYPALHLDDTDYWFYIWNGVYTDEDYELVSYNNLVNGYLNINKAYEYITGETGHPTDYGSILNFYGGANNPTATGREQTTEKPVEVKSRITAYAADNGVPPEFLESDELWWQFNSNYVDNEGTPQYNPQLVKSNHDHSEFGSEITTSTGRVVYHQKYENTVLNGLNSQTLDIKLTQSYSRTGIDAPINIIQNNSSSLNYFILEWDPNYSEQYYKPIIYQSAVCYYPYLWNWDNVKVNDMYFHRYTTNHNNRITEVWDRRRIDVYINLGEGNGILHFNGKEWVQENSFNPANSFYLMKLMNYQQLYHTDFSYNVIETADYDPNNPSAGGHYSLTDDSFSYNVDTYGGVVENATSYNRFCPPYKSESNEWSQWINDCGEGMLSLVLPTLENSIADVIVDVNSSSLLGTTGGSVVFSTQAVPVYYAYEGTGRITPDGGDPYDVALSEQNIGSLFGTIGICPDNGSSIDFVPANVSYVKGEHLDLNISMDVPESNLGQMFSQSDIKYVIDKQNNYDEKYQMPEFKMNTYNQMVNDSFSYILFNSQRADPDEFVINGLAVRPECYTVQAYMNWLSTIRKSYTKTLVPLKINKMFSNYKTFITSPEVGDNRLMVVSDSWDVKSDRHSISSIEANGLNVNTVNSYSVFELPRKARNERWNYPTAKVK